jgi:hypothetical protein
MKDENPHSHVYILVERVKESLKEAIDGANRELG